jgi:tRNA(adenine34) deaminase
MSAPAPSVLLPPPGWSSWEEIMGEALHEARAARDLGEVPVGAIVIDDRGAIIGRGRNSSIHTHDPTAHAEIAAIRDACSNKANYRLPLGAVLVATLEPCLMCLGAAIHARLGGLVFGAHDSKSGAIESCLRGLELPFLNHRLPALSGIRSAECAELLTTFFKSKRQT